MLGSTGFGPLASLFAHANGAVAPGVVVGMVLIIIGLCFKVSAVPFHMWTPDVYEGAPTPVTAFFSTAPKVAAMALFARVALDLFGPLVAQWQQVIVFVAVASMLVGALAAIMQTNIKRLLAYSSIGHVGYMLIGLASANVAGVQGMMIYLAIYVFMSAGAFGCVMMMRRDGRPVEDIRELGGLSRTQPLLAIVFAIFMFSLAGIPPLAGFFAKFYVLIAAVKAGMAWLAVVGVITSVIGAFYYLKVVKVMYFDEPARPFDTDMPLPLRAAIAIAAVFTMLFFLSPAPLVASAQGVAEELLK